MTTSKNIILITVDCLRADHLSIMGYSKKTSPCIDKLAKKGVLFNQAIAQAPLTRPSFQSIFTSTYPLMYGGYERLKRERTTIAEVLSREGYVTGAFHSNPWLSGFFGYNRGFRTFEDSLSKGGTKKYKAVLGEKLKERSKKIYSLMKGVLSAGHWMRGKLKPLKEKFYMGANEITGEALQWLEENCENNFFLWIHYMDAHHPHLPIDDCWDFYSESIDDKKILNIQRKKREPYKLSEDELRLMIDLYDGEIRYVDTHVGKLSHKLRKMNLSKRTLKIITADHGKRFLNRGEPGFTRLYDENIRVPLIINGGSINEGVIKSQVQLLNIPPTILDYLGIDNPKSYLGKSLIPLVEGEGTGDKHAMSEELVGAETAKGVQRGNIHRACRTMEWKCVLEERTARRELYNLKDDPNEIQDLSDKEKVKTRELLERIKNYVEVNFSSNS